MSDYVRFLRKEACKVLVFYFIFSFFKIDFGGDQLTGCCN